MARRGEPGGPLGAPTDSRLRGLKALAGPPGNVSTWRPCVSGWSVAQSRVGASGLFRGFRLPARSTVDGFEGRQRPLEASDEADVLGRRDGQLAVLDDGQEPSQGLSGF